MNIPDNLIKLLTQQSYEFIQKFFKYCPLLLQDNIMYKCYQKNHILIETNDACAFVYILIKGRLQAIEEKFPEFNYSFTELNAIEIIGDFELFTEDIQRIVTLSTLEKSHFLVIPAIDYIEWLKKDVNALFIRTQMLITQLTKQTQTERQLFMMDNNKRLMFFLLGEYAKQNISTANIHYTREQISNKIGCSLRTINRIILSLQEEGLISLNHGKIQVNSEQVKKIQKCL